MTDHFATPNTSACPHGTSIFSPQGCPSCVLDVVGDDRDRLRERVGQLTMELEEARIDASYQRAAARTFQNGCTELQDEVDRLRAEVAMLETYRPCEVCRQPGADHNACTGDCSSLCCALDASEATIAEALSFLNESVDFDRTYLAIGLRSILQGEQ